MFLVQACFGVGATIAPFISTAFAQRVPNRSYLYFLVAMGVGILCFVLMISVFELRTEDQIVGRKEDVRVELVDGPKVDIVPQGDTVQGDVDKEGDVQIPAVVPQEMGMDGHSGQTAGEGRNQSSGAKLSRILRTPVVYALLGYNFLYVSDQYFIVMLIQVRSERKSVLEDGW
jgi:MFS family permease